MPSVFRVAPLLLLLAACGGPAEPEKPDLGTTGNGKLALTTTVEAPSAPVTSTLGVLARISVPGGLAGDLSGTLVTFHVTKGGGSVYAGSAITNAAGEARERWTLGTLVGEQELEVRAVDQTTGAPIVFDTAKATGQAGPPVTWNGDPQRVDLAVGASWDYSTARLLGFDIYGNPAPVPGTWTLTRIIARSTGPEPYPECSVSGTVITCPASRSGAYLTVWDVMLHHETGHDVKVSIVVGTM